jgi:atypical dual specificity phosphatase
MVEFNRAGGNGRPFQFIPMSFPFRKAFALMGGVFAVTYLLFQKKWLPLPVAKVVSKILFLPTFPITAMLRLGNYWTEVDETLILGCAPFSLLNHPQSLKKLGVTGVVNMCYEYDGPLDDYKKLGIEQLHLPTVDHTEPTPETLIDAVAFIKSHQKKGEKVYVHCKAGHGRAASVALCWLINEHPDKSPKVNSILFFMFL